MHLRCRIFALDVISGIVGNPCHLRISKGARNKLVVPDLYGDQGQSEKKMELHVICAEDRYPKEEKEDSERQEQR